MNSRSAFAAAAALLGLLAAASARADDKSAAVAIPAPPKGKGEVVFFRPGGLGPLISCAVSEGGTKVSSLPGNRYFIVVAAPGKHAYTVESEVKDQLTLEVEADEVQFAQCHIKMGIMAGRPTLRPATEAEFRTSGIVKMPDASKMGPDVLRQEQVTAAMAAVPAATPAGSIVSSAAATQAATAPTAK